MLIHQQKGKIGIWKHISKRALILWPYFLLALKISCFICIIYTISFGWFGIIFLPTNGSWSKDDLYSRFLLYSRVKHMWGEHIEENIYIQEICFLSHSYMVYGCEAIRAHMKWILFAEHITINVTEEALILIWQTYKCWIFLVISLNHSIRFVVLCFKFTEYTGLWFCHSFLSSCHMEDTSNRFLSFWAKKTNSCIRERKTVSSPCYRSNHLYNDWKELNVCMHAINGEWSDFAIISIKILATPFTQYL